MLYLQRFNNCPLKVLDGYSACFTHGVQITKKQEEASWSSAAKSKRGSSMKRNFRLFKMQFFKNLPNPKTTLMAQRKCGSVLAVGFKRDVVTKVRSNVCT